MTLRSTRILIVLVTFGILTSFAAVFAWRASVWNRRGVTGLIYQPPLDKKAPPINIGMFKPRARRVVAVFPGLGANRAGVRIDDEVLTINGIPIEDQAKLKEVAARAKSGDVIQFRIRRDGREMTLPVRLTSPLASWRMQFGVFTSMFVALVFLTISFFVYWLRPDSRRARVFYAASVVGSLFFLTGISARLDMLGMGITTMQQVMAQWAVVWMLYLLLAVLMVMMMLHLALVFPRDHPLVTRFPHLVGAMYLAPFAVPLGLVVTGFVAEQRKRLGVPFAVLVGISVVLFLAPSARVVYAALKRRSWQVLLEMPYTVMAGLAFLTPLLITIVRSASEEMRTATVIVIVLMALGWPVVLTLAYMFLTCVVLYQSYRNADEEEKRQVRWPLWGTLVAVLTIAIMRTGFLLLLNFRPQIASAPTFNMIYGLINQAAYLLIPISFAFAILKYRLMEIDLIIKKTLVYTMLTAFVVFAYLVLVGGVGTLLVRSTGVKNQTVTVVSTLAIAALLIPVRNKLQKGVERKLFRRKYDYATAVESMAAQIAALRDPEALLRKIAEIAQQALLNRSVAIFVKEPGEPFAPAATIGLPDEAVEKTRLNWPPEMLSTLPLVFAVPTLPDTESAKLRRVGGVYGAQARTKEQTAAIVIVGKKLSDEPFDADDLEFLKNLGGQVAEALSIRRSEKEQQEARQAREIQRALLPAQIPQMPGFEIDGMSEPARAVGGDYYDVIDLGNGKLALCIADVCGKGMTAALLMSGLQGAVRSLSEAETSPAELATRVRRVVCRNLSAGKFVTFFYAVLDANARTIRYTNAGHNPPIVVRANGEIVRLREGGPILGRLFAETKLNEGKIDVQPGDRVVLFTDGVSEARNESEEEFGEDALAELIRSSQTTSAKELEGVIVTAISTFTGNNFHDDVTLLVVAAH